MKGVPAAAGSGDRLTVTLFLAGVFHLILILGISFAPPVASQGDVPTLEVLLVNNALPDSSVNEDANYLAERTQRGSGNSADGQTRQPAAGAGAETMAGMPEGGLESPATGRQRRRRRQAPDRNAAASRDSSPTRRMRTQRPPRCRARPLPVRPRPSPAATRMNSRSRARRAANSS